MCLSSPGKDVENGIEAGPSVRKFSKKEQDWPAGLVFYQLQVPTVIAQGKGQGNTQVQFITGKAE